MTIITNSVLFRDMDDAQKRAAVAQVSDRVLARIFPGKQVQATSVQQALADADAAFTVAKWPLFYSNPATLGAEDGAIFDSISSEVATVRTDTGKWLGNVGTDYGVIQTAEAFAPLQALLDNGDVQIRNVQVIDGGARIRITALLGVSSFPSLSGMPNTIAHMAVFETSHNGKSKTTAVIYDVRLECLNGMTSRHIVTLHSIKHTSKASARLGAYAQGLLSSLLGDVKAEIAVFQALVVKPMTRDAFVNLATDLVGGATSEEDSQHKRTRRQNEIDELVANFDGGNQGAGNTAWGGYNSITRWLEAKREQAKSAAAQVSRFQSQLDGDGQRKLTRALKVLSA